MGKVVWLDCEFQIYQPPASWDSVAGLYIFAGMDPTRTLWRPLYVGHAESLTERLLTHEYWQEAVRLGATHIHVRVEPQEEIRLLFQERLIRSYQPYMNAEYR